MIGVSLFSGCGGSDLGAKRAGVNIIFANDKYLPAVQTYRNYRSLIATEETDIIHGDVRKITQFPDCEIVIGCYPCQSFTMGGNRTPETDDRTTLYLEFLRFLCLKQPKFFVVENVAGLLWLNKGEYLRTHLEAFGEAGSGYKVSHQLLDGKDYGIPQDRKRLFLVGVRKDLGAQYEFPTPTHGPKSLLKTPYVSHGDALINLPLECPGDYYHPNNEPFSWWFMSRNRKRAWNAPSFTVISNARHATLHPASPIMRLVESRWQDGSKQIWEFTDQYEHCVNYPERPVLENPRRLSWRESAVLQSFPDHIEFSGNLKQKFMQIGNAVPPLLMERIIAPITSGTGLRASS